MVWKTVSLPMSNKLKYCTLTFLPCQFHSLFTWVVNLKIKELNCEKAGFRAIQMENDADMLILWSCIINSVTEYSMHQ